VGEGYAEDGITAYRRSDGGGAICKSMNIALAFILHPTDGTILIAQRKDGVHKAGYWEFPGGKCRAGETPEACAVRETREETGLEIEVLEVWPAITHVYPERTVVLYPFLCQAQSGDAAAIESRQIAWVLPADLSRYPFPEANQPLLERLREIIRK
jgi:8-oxo-dGTP diphosphatase